MKRALDSGKANAVKASVIEPMLLLRTDKLPEGPAWRYEFKLDGYRALAMKSGGHVRLVSRHNNDFTARYPSVAKALAKMPDETVLDGEVGGARLMVSRRLCVVTLKGRKPIGVCGFETPH
jgi:bifunctional non-homologous end joining protein LigD